MSGPARRVRATPSRLERLSLGLVAAVFVCVGLVTHGSHVASANPPRARDTIVIGSKNFTENRLLAEIMAQLIESKTPHHVERRPNLGGTTVVFTALRSGEIDIYPEYTGTGWTIHLGKRERAPSPLRTFTIVQREFERRFAIAWLSPFGFSNSYALAMRKSRADGLGIRSISDLKAHQGELRAAVSHEFLSRDDGYPGLAQAYGLEFEGLRGMEHGLAYEALQTGKADLIDTWTTDGKLLRYPIRLLEDDKRFFPPYEAAPIVRYDTLVRVPELRRVLMPLAMRIDDEKMRELNAAVEERGGSFEEVARAFLVESKLLSGVGSTVSSLPGDQNDGLFASMWSRRAELGGLVLEHLMLTAVALLLAIVIGVPTGIALTRSQKVAVPVLNALGVIQTVPSLALLAFMIPIPGLGLGARSAIAALFLYALLPIVRNAYTGIQAVDPDLVEVARGIGLSSGQTLRLVQIPLAMQTIMAGVRTAAVISIGVATLAAFIGAGGLGDPIVTGLQLNDTNLILSGGIPAALLAILVDGLLARLERSLVPRGLQIAQQAN